MSATSRRTAPLPRGWDRTRLRIARRDDNTCHLAYPTICLGYCPPGNGGECDHIGDPHDHHPDNLRWVCQPCHATRTARQANEAKPRRRRDPPPHPGLL